MTDASSCNSMCLTRFWFDYPNDDVSDHGACEQAVAVSNESEQVSHMRMVGEGARTQGGQNHRELL